MKKNQRLQDWERQAICDAYMDGEKTAAIASEFQIVASHVRVVVRKSGLTLRMPGRPVKPQKVKST